MHAVKYKTYNNLKEENRYEQKSEFINYNFNIFYKYDIQSQPKY